jgi:Galactosyltransferase
MFPHQSYMHTADRPGRCATAQECYRCLPNKTLAFLMEVDRQWQARWVVKVDDDVYLAVHQMPAALAQWQAAKAHYVGCMKNGAVFGNNDSKWFEPLWTLIGPEYYMHAWGSAYVLSGDALAKWIAPNEQLLRKSSNEGKLLPLL